MFFRKIKEFFRTKYDPSKSPLLSAIEFLNAKQNPWQDGDEWSLSLLTVKESNIGWGSVDSLGTLTTLDGRPVLAYACSEHSNYSGYDCSMLVSSSRESFSYFTKGAGRTSVFHGNRFLGTIDENFQCFSERNELIGFHKTYSGNFTQRRNAIGTSSFHFHTGMTGWYNVPPTAVRSPNWENLGNCRALAVKGNRLPDAYERSWLMAFWFFLRLGPLTTERDDDLPLVDPEQWLTDMFTDTSSS